MSDTEIEPLSEIRFLKDLKNSKDSNILKYSEDFTKAFWLPSSGEPLEGPIKGIKAISQTAILNPTNTTRVSSISGSPSIYQDIFFNSRHSVGQYTFSVYAHNSSLATDIELRINFIDLYVKSASIIFNPQNGNIRSKETQNRIPLDNFYSQNVGNGWYRYSITVNQISAVDTRLRAEIFYNSKTPNAAPWSNNIILWGAQLQKDNTSINYYKTLQNEKSSLVDNGFVNQSMVEPSLGIPYIENLLTNSQTYSSVWTSLNVNLTGNVPSFYSPISTFDVYKVTPTTTAGTHQLSRTVTLPQTGIPYTFSTYLRNEKNNPTSYRLIRLVASSPQDSYKTYLSAMFNLETGVPLASGSNNVSLSSFSITPSFSGWYRLNLTGTYSYLSSLFIQIYFGQQASTNFTFSGDGIRHFYIWGSQLEKGIRTNEYIKTDSSPKTGISHSPVWSSTEPTSSYYFLLAKADNDSYINSRRFTGSDSLFITKNKLVYNNINPKFDFDVSGDFHALSAFFDTLSTNQFAGNSTSFNDFESLQFNSDINISKQAFFNSLTSNYVIITSLTSLSTRYLNYFVHSNEAKRIFSSITWNVTANGYLSAYNINALSSIITPYISSTSARFISLYADNLTISSSLCSLSTLKAEEIHGFINIDTTSPLYYDSNNNLTTSLSSVYYLGVKPTDSYSTDNISIVRSLTGNWDGQDGSIIETYPVLKPYFKNIKQVFDYVDKQGLYGDELNVLIYDNILQNNVNTDSGFSNSGCSFQGNIKARYMTLPVINPILVAQGFKEGDYVWNGNNNTDSIGKITYWGIDRLNFSNLNIYGMYEIGTSINSNGKKQYSLKKPYNYSPRKITFRTYISTSKILAEGETGSTASVWNSLFIKDQANVQVRPVYFNGDEMDINIHNLCFEFDTNANDSTCLYVKSGRVYLHNVTVAALNSGNYAYGAVLAWPNSTIYFCGENQIDPYLLTPSTWNSWTSLPTAIDQYYFPGYGLAIVGNKAVNTPPTFFSEAFIQSWRSRVFFMDFQVNRRIGRFSYLNASIILDGNFTSKSFYYLKDHAKVYVNNYIFKTNTFTLSNFDAEYFKSPSTRNDINSFYTYNRDNFYYVYFDEANSTFTPNYFEINNWIFDDAEDLINAPINFVTHFTSQFVPTLNPKYIFETDTKTVNLSGMVYNYFQKNSLHSQKPYNELEGEIVSDNFNFYNYIDPNDLPLYNTNGLYALITPINNTSSYTLNYYS